MTQPDRDSYDFDVALSFAGEDREYVEDINEALKQQGIRTFLDTDYLADLWGEDLVEFFDDIYRKRSLFAMLFISCHYGEKMWPRHERRSALVRALKERSAYILPVRLDDTEIDGLRPTVGYLDTRRTGIDGLVRAVLAKLAGRSSWPDGWPGDRAPRGQRETEQVLSERPPGWEYLYLAGVLNIEKEKLEGMYLDHELRYAAPSAERLEDQATAISFLSGAMNKVQAFVASLVRMMEPDVQERAFGPSGVPGDPERIKRLATRWNSVYQGLLGWAARLRGTRHDDQVDRLFEIAARFVDKPIEQYRSFVDEFTEQMDRIPSRLASKEPVSLELTLTISVDEQLVEDFNAELQRIELEGF